MRQACSATDKVVQRDDNLANSMGLKLDYARTLPDVHPDSPKVIFVEFVATDGPITQQRKLALMQVAEQEKMKSEHVYFVTAFSDRSAPAFRKLVSELAWGTFVWFRSEPEKLLALRKGQTTELFSLFKY